MVRMTADDLRRLADMVENRERYNNMCGVVYASIKYHPNGLEFLEFEQPCSYAECDSSYYRYVGKAAAAPLFDNEVWNNPGEYPRKTR